VSSIFLGIGALCIDVDSLHSADEFLPSSQITILDDVLDSTALIGIESIRKMKSNRRYGLIRLKNILIALNYYMFIKNTINYFKKKYRAYKSLMSLLISIEFDLLTN
jgi:hypothetical protein